MQTTQTYKNELKYKSEKAQIAINERYWDLRREDFFVIEEIDFSNGIDAMVTLKYDRGSNIYESGDFILYHIQMGQYNLAK